MADDKLVQLRADILEIQKLSKEIADLEKAQDKIKDRVIKALGIGGVLEFNQTRCKIVRSMRRTIPWKEIAFAFAKKIYPTKDTYRSWLKSLVKKYRKKATKPFAKITVLKDKEK